MASPTPFDLPPWGVMDESLQQAIDDDPFPRDWNAAPTEWATWLEAVTKQLGASLWPPYQPAVWDTPQIRQLVDRDFELLDRLHPALDAPIDALKPTNVTHRAFFFEEDPDDGVWGRGYSRYDATLSPSIREWIVELIDIGLKNKASTVDLQLKRVMQRPRAWQVAMLQQRTGYRYQMAVSAYTPSLISGHCFQSVMACANAFATLATQLPGKSLAVFQQFTVDIGDRRVLAGVHYPSDNLASWFTALKLIPFVFDVGLEKAVREFVWGAVIQRSRVFAAIRKDIDTYGDDSPYASIVRALAVAAA
jgi:hypothetical protein